MKQKIRHLGIIALTALIAFTFAACGDTVDGDTIVIDKNLSGKTWELNNGAEFIFDDKGGGTYKVPGTTPGETITKYIVVIVKKGVFDIKTLDGKEVVATIYYEIDGEKLKIIGAEPSPEAPDPNIANELAEELQGEEATDKTPDHGIDFPVPGTTAQDKFVWLKANAKDSGSYIIEIADDESLSPQELSYQGKKVTILLTGDPDDIIAKAFNLLGLGTAKVISLDGEDGSLFTVKSDVTLILGKNITLKGHVSSGDPGERYSDFLVSVEGGRLMMEDGSTITGHESRGGVVSVDGTFTMKGGEISGNKTTTYDCGVVTVYSEESTAIFKMSSGSISTNTGSGSAVLLVGNVAFTMSGGEISDNKGAKSGGGVKVVQGAVFTMSGGDIKGNDAKDGGGVIVKGGAFTMSGGTISGNEALGDVFDSAGGHGGGVMVSNYEDEEDGIIFNGTFKMNGGTISGNEAFGSEGGGGGVTAVDGATFTMSGGSISNNKAVGSDVVTESGGTGGGVAVWDATFIMSGGDIEGNDAIDAGGVIVYGESIVSTFTMSGGKISGNEATGITGVDEKGGGGGVVLIGNAKLIMSGNASISDNQASGGGGVAVVEGATFTMSGNASISGNKAIGGGGVMADKDGTFEMNGGIISGNEAQAGGGVQVSESDFTMSTGEISGNKAFVGGGVVAGYDGNFFMNGGVIANNEADYGGGVYVDENGGFEMFNGTIKENTATDTGGGVIVVKNYKFEMSGGEISGNEALIGGGVAVAKNATFKMSNGTISGNNALGGGGVIVQAGSTFTMSGGGISGNEAQEDGGGVFVNNANFIMSGGNIYGTDAPTGYANIATRNGASLFMDAYGIGATATAVYSGAYGNAPIITVIADGSDFINTTLPPIVP